MFSFLISFLEKQTETFSRKAREREREKEKITGEAKERVKDSVEIAIVGLNSLCSAFSVSFSFCTEIFAKLREYHRSLGSGT